MQQSKTIFKDKTTSGFSLAGSASAIQMHIMMKELPKEKGWIMGKKRVG